MIPLTPDQLMRSAALKTPWETWEACHQRIFEAGLEALAGTPPPRPTPRSRSEDRKVLQRLLAQRDIVRVADAMRALSLGEERRAYAQRLLAAEVRAGRARRVRGQRGEYRRALNTRDTASVSCS